MIDQRRKFSPLSVGSGRFPRLPGLVVVCWFCTACLGTSPLAADGLGGGGQITQADCVSSDVWQDILETVRENQANRGERFRGFGLPPKFTFHPMGGRLYRDLFTHNFVDVEPAFGILDWDCTNFTYDGHDASDVHIRSFGEQAVGVPVFAAQDGRVVAVTDGCDDMNTCPFAPCSHCVNFVAVDNDFGRVTYYLHLRKNSVAVVLDQEVRAGEVLGFVGSSGQSASPHLHFATYDDEAVVEPYAGECREGESGWEHQTAIRRDLYLRDAGLTFENLSLYPGYPNTFPRSGQIALSDPKIYIWALPINLPAASTWRFRFQRPDGSTVFNTGNVGFQGGAGNQFFRASWWWWSFDVPEMHTTTGTWTVRFDINGVQRAAMPVEVRSNRTPDFNRAPTQVSVSIEPTAPSINDVLVCSIFTDLVLDDRDYDIVRYRYRWTANGVVVRDIVSAAHSDALPHHTATDGQSVQCSVTPSDGQINGPTTSQTVTLCVAPTINQDPQGATLCEAELHTMFVSASGLPAPTIQWRLNGQAIPGATSTALTITAGAMTEGIYDVLVSNSCTSVLSDWAEVLVTTIQDCDDQNDCTADLCANATCSHVPSSGNSCDDGQFCTGFEVCKAGQCIGTPIDRVYADLVPLPYGDGSIELSDLQCMLQGYLKPDLCPGSDLWPCGGDGAVELADILAFLDAYYGLPGCPDPCTG